GDGEAPRLTGTVAAHLCALAALIGTVGTAPGNELLTAHRTSHATLSTHLHPPQEHLLTPYTGVLRCPPGTHWCQRSVVLLLLSFCVLGVCLVLGIVSLPVGVLRVSSVGSVSGC